MLLSVSQPAISRSIAQLEKTLDQRLFERVGGRLVPTREALAIANELEPIFSALNRLGDQSAVISVAHSGPLRIAAPPTIAHRFLPERIARFMKYNPDLEVIFDVVSRDVLISSIADGRFDIGFTSTVPSHPGVLTETLITTQAICVLPSRHRLVERKFVQPQDLRDEPFISSMRRHSERVSIDQVFEKAGVRRKVIMETATAVSAVRFVQEGLGIAILNPFLIKDHIGTGVEVRQFTPSIPFQASFLLPSNRPRSPAVVAFTEMIKSDLQ